MAAGKLTLALEVGASYDRTATLRRGGVLVDLTGCTATAAIRSSDRDDATTLLALTTENGRIELGGAAGTLRLLLSEDDTLLLEGVRSAVWDLFVRFDADTVWKLFRGAVTIEARRTPTAPAV